VILSIFKYDTKNGMVVELMQTVKITIPAVMSNTCAESKELSGLD